MTKAISECTACQNDNPDHRCVRITRSPSETTGAGIHLSGWPPIVASLADHQCSQGILLEDFVEQRFLYDPPSAPLDKPWIGIFHHPHQIPAFVSPTLHLSHLQERDDFLASQPFMIGAISLSEYLSQHLRAMFSIPCHTIKLAADVPARQWCEASFLKQPHLQLVQVGWTLRNTRAIFQTPAPAGTQRVRLLANHEWVRAYDADVAAYWDQQGSRTDAFKVADRGFIPADELESLLCESVIFTELFDASGSTVIVDCIVRNTPLLINRHPAAIEYLTADYPLFYEDIGQIPELLTSENILAAHRYLKHTIDRSWLSTAAFTVSVGDAVAAIQNETVR